MVQIDITYTGQKHCDLRHGPSGSIIHTDAPKDNQGLGQDFSPTDLVGAALGSCILTTMAIVAERDGLAFSGASASVEKHMTTEGPRKIAALKVQLRLPKSLQENERKKMEHVATTCPVHRSLSHDVKIEVETTYV